MDDDIPLLKPTATFPITIVFDSIKPLEPLPWPEEDDMTEELDRRRAELSALDTQPDVPGIQSGYDLEAARRGNRFLEGLMLGIFIGAGIVWALSYVLPFLAR